MDPEGAGSGRGRQKVEEREVTDAERTSGLGSYTLGRGPPIRDPTPWDVVLTVGRTPPGSLEKGSALREPPHPPRWEVEKDQEAGRHRHFHGQQPGGEGRPQSAPRGRGGEGQRDVLCPMGSLRELSDGSSLPSGCRRRDAVLEPGPAMLTG